MRLFDRWTCLALLGCGAFMSVAASRYTVFDDEAHSCRLYVLPAGQLLGELWRGADPDPPLYYLLQSSWVRLFGVAPLGLRSLSILFFLAGLVAMRAAAVAWFDRRAGLATLAICALHPAHLFFGFAARWYALMFLVVALLLRATAACRDRPLLSAASVAWTLAAAAACYTNYFGPVILVLLCMAGLCSDWQAPRARRRWLARGVIALALFAPWLPVFWQRLVEFPASAGGGASHLGTLARLAITLAAGNLAGPAAWWVWAPLAAFAALMLALLAAALMSHGHEKPAIGPLILVVLGSIAAGVATRTLVDKYVLLLSGPACLLAAALISRAWERSNPPPSVRPNEPLHTARPSWQRRAGQAAAAALALGWLGCGVNLVTQQHWSSLRWLDPFPEVVESMQDSLRDSPSLQFIGSHPSLRYYAALAQARDDSPKWRIAAGVWLRRHQAQATDPASPLRTPDSVTSHWHAAAMHDGSPSLPNHLVTITTAGFAQLPDWELLLDLLHRHYEPSGEPRQFLEDPDAALKDRLDPGVRHPRWRITMQQWQLKGHEREAASQPWHSAPADEP